MGMVAWLNNIKQAVTGTDVGGGKYAMDVNVAGGSISSSGGPIQYDRQGVDTEVLESATPSLSRPLPIKALDSNGADAIGILTETAPASDTASSGLNGRLQRIAQRLTSMIALFPASLGQKTMAASFAVNLASDQTLPLPSGASTSAKQDTAQTSLTSIDAKLAALDYKERVRKDYSGGSVTTGAWTQLIASTANATAMLEIFDSSGQTMEIGTGAAASEVSKCYIVPGGNGQIPIAIAAATRISVRAVSATASTGELLLNLYG